MSSLFHRDSHDIDWRSGNLGVDLMMKIVRGESPPSLEERTRELSFLKSMGISSVEDYVGWWPLEPRFGVLEPGPYLQHAREVKRLGMSYAIYPWIHAVPPWALERDDWVPFTCARTGVRTFSPSIWAPFTKWAYRHVYQLLSECLGDWVDAVYLAGPADYGEVGYPTGMAKWVVPYPETHDHEGDGPWCGDPYAQLSLRRFLRRRYENRNAILKAWGMDHFPDDNEIWPLPDRSSPQGAHVDFQRWYSGSMTVFFRWLIALAKRHFPKTPIEFRIGHGSEWVLFGNDIDDLVSLAASSGVGLRSTQASLDYFNQKRLSTPCHFLDVPFSSEPMVDRVPREFIERVFKDLSSRAGGVFEYPQHLRDSEDIARQCRSWFQNEKSSVDVALLFPTTDHRAKPDQAMPPELFEAADYLRELFDYDVIAEPLIAKGALSSYRVVILIGGGRLSTLTVERIDEWVKGGGLIAIVGKNPILSSTEAWQGDWLGGWRGEWSRLEYEGTPECSTVLEFGSGRDLYFLSGDWHGPESSHWFWPDSASGERCRWTGEKASVRLPLKPHCQYRLQIDVAHPGSHRGSRAKITVNGVDSWDLHDATFSVDRVFEARDNSLSVEFHAEAFRASEEDHRDLGVVVRQLRLSETGGALENPTDCLPGLWANLSVEEIRRTAVKSWGKGLVAAISHLEPPIVSAFLSTLISKRSEFLPKMKPPVLIDGVGDGVWSTALETKMLIQNRRSRTLVKTLYYHGQRIDVSLPPYSLVRLDPNTEETWVLQP